MSGPVPNPIIGGFHPDPSICRVGADFYIANSSFEWFPGVPIHHSRDLVHWRLVGNALDRASQLPLAGIGHSGGIWAPTLRWHAGRFYLITTHVGGRGNLLVSATDPAGPWSEPIWIDAQGYDPSLFFDDDGTCYLTKAGSDQGGHGIVQYRIDPDSGEHRSPARLVWAGSGGFGVEGPHLLRHGAWYYLLCAEGATHVGHMVTIARSAAADGPYTSCPRNPILTHRDQLVRTILATGHGDLVQAQDSSWWMVCLGIRSHGSLCMAQHVLGRETFLAPVTWEADGWPLVNAGAGVAEEVASTLPDHSWPAPAPRDDFDADRLEPCWVFLRNPAPGCWSLAERPGHLCLHGTTPSLETALSPSMMVRRQEHRDCRFRVRLSVQLPAPGDEAGLTVFLNGGHHQDFGLVRHASGIVLQLRRRADDIEQTAAVLPVTGTRIDLEAWCNPWAIGYFYADPTATPAPWTRLAKASTKTLTTEFGGGFTGLMLGVYALGSASAAFDWIDYSPCERMP